MKHNSSCRPYLQEVATSASAPPRSLHIYPQSQRKQSFRTERRVMMVVE